MIICHITTVHPRYDIRIFSKECISLANKGNKVHLIVNDENRDEIIDGVNISSINKPFKNKFDRIVSRASRKKAFLLAKSFQADIYHIHDPELLGLGIKMKKRGYKVIYDAHEDTPRQILTKEWIPKFIRPTFSKVFEIYENWCLKHFDAVITTTPYLKKRFEKYNKFVWEVCNFPSLKDIEFSGDRYSVLNPACYVGDLSYTRGLLEISKATNIINLKLQVCGTFLSKGLKEAIYSKYNNVDYLGYLNRVEISELLIGSSVGFVTLHNTPNDYMAYPIKMFEYMAAGIPVIASNFPQYKTIIEENECGVCVNPLDVKEISTAIMSIISDEKFANKLRNNGYKAILEKYNWEKESENLFECYLVVEKTSKAP